MKIGKYTHKQYCKKVFDKHNNEFTVISQYQGSRDPILIRHNICRTETWMRADTIFTKDGVWCSKCKKDSYKQKRLYTTEIFKEKVKEAIGEDYTVLGEYIKSQIKILMKHNICGKTYEVIPNVVLKHKSRCPYCYGTLKLTKEEYQQKLDDIYNGEYILIGDYINQASKSEVLHIKCNKIWNVKLHNLLNGSGCPYCKQSKGEESIEQWCIKNNIKYITQQTFDNCKNIIKLHYDFALYDIYNNLICLIEYDGKQHYEPIKGWGGEEGYLINKKRDNIKNKYCIENNIKLIRIPYWEFDNIDKILDKEILSKE